jgi:hypothetical protein
MSFESGTTAGEYTMTVGGTTAGSCEFGKNIYRSLLFEPITGADRWGDTVIGGIIRGSGAKIRFKFKTWNTAVLKSLDILGSDSLADLLTVPTIGKDAYDIAKTLVLTPVTGTSAASNGPSSITIHKAIVAPGQDIMINLDSKLRTVEVEMLMFPYDVSGTYRFATVA